MKVKNRLRELREERKLSLKRLQDDLLEKENIKVGRASLNNYERGEQSPKKEVWEHLADYFGVTVPYVMGLYDFEGIRVLDKYGELVVDICFKTGIAKNDKNYTVKRY